MIARTAQLPLAPDAVLTLVEVYRDSRNRSLLELHALTLLAPRRRFQFASITTADEAALRQLLRTADLAVVGDIRYLGWRPSSLLGAVPVLFVRAAGGERYQRPVVAIDPHGAEHVLQVTQEVVPAEGVAMTAVCTTMAEHARRFVTRLLASLGAFGAGWTRYFGRGDARAAIRTVAKRERADLVVVGCRPRTAISRLLFGSVSRGVLRDVQCDVLAVPVGAS